MLLYPDVLVSFTVYSILPSKHANAMLTFVSKLPQEQLASNRTKEVKVVFRLNKGWSLDSKWNDYSTPGSSGSQM